MFCLDLAVFDCWFGLLIGSLPVGYLAWFCVFGLFGGLFSLVCLLVGLACILFVDGVLISLFVLFDCVWEC